MCWIEIEYIIYPFRMYFDNWKDIKTRWRCVTETEKLQYITSAATPGEAFWHTVCEHIAELSKGLYGETAVQTNLLREVSKQMEDQAADSDSK